MGVIDAYGLGAVLNREVYAIVEATERGLIEAAKLIRDEAKKLTPVLTGNLRTSAFIAASSGVKEPKTPPKFKTKVAEQRRAEWIDATEGAVARCASAKAAGQFRVEVRYSAVYAVLVHENPRAGNTGGFSPSGRKYTAGREPSGRKSRAKAYATTGQWKFLETAFKENEQRCIAIIEEYARKGASKK